MYERIFFFKLVDEIELGSDQRNYTFMRIDINLRLKVRGIDSSMNHIIADSNKFENSKQRGKGHTYIF